MNATCIIIEDEFPATQLLIKYIELTKELTLLSTFSNADLALGYLSNNQPDIVFLDINITGMSGLDLYKHLNQKPYTILTTAYNQFAIEGFELGVVDYLLKPFSYDRFLIAVSRAQERMSVRSNESSLVEDDLFWVKSGYKTVKIKYDDILYIEGLREYVMYHLENGEQIISLNALKSLEESLARRHFIRIHKSYLVNVKRVSVIGKKSLKIGTKDLPVGSTYRDNITILLRDNK